MSLLALRFLVDIFSMFFDILDALRLARDCFLDALRYVDRRGRACEVNNSAEDSLAVVVVVVEDTEFSTFNGAS
jgi:hypothetical protein